MQHLVRAILVLGALVAGMSSVFANDPPVLGYWTHIQMAGPNNPAASFEILLTADGIFLERIIISPGVATYAGTWTYEADTSTLTYFINQWTPVTIVPPAANQNVAVHVDFTNGGGTMIMDQPGGVPIQWTRQANPGGAQSKTLPPN